MSPDAQALHDALKGRDDVRWKDVKGVLQKADLGAQVQAWNELLHAGPTVRSAPVVRRVDPQAALPVLLGSCWTVATLPAAIRSNCRCHFSSVWRFSSMYPYLS